MVKRGPCYGLKHQKEKRSMDYFAGLDVSVKDTSVCIVDDTGRITREVKVASEPDALLTVLRNLALPLQADWTRSRTAVAMAVQCARRSRLAGDLCRDAAHAGGAEGTRVPKMWALLKAPTIRRSYPWKRLRQSVSILRSRSFRSTALTRRAMSFSVVSSSGATCCLSSRSCHRV